MEQENTGGNVVDVFNFGVKKRPNSFKRKELSSDVFSPTKRKKLSLAASRLLSEKVKSSRDDTISESSQSPVQQKREKVESPSPPSSPSPPLSPGLQLLSHKRDQKSARLLDKANNVLQKLQNSPSSISDELKDYSPPPLTPPPSAEKVNLRVRYKGKIHRYKISECDPFADVAALLAKELSMDADSKRILLSHRTNPISLTDSPVSLGLTTASIIDAVVTAESPPTHNSVLASNGVVESDGITITVQSSTERVMYNLAEDDPLQKVMAAFASKLQLPVSDLKFTFDGEPISPSQTAQDLELEDGDCVDVLTTTVPPTTTGAPDVTWHYRDDSGLFVPYTSSDSAQIEAMFQGSSISQPLDIVHRKYSFDFASMKQVNVGTGYRRDIQRVMLGSVSGAAHSTAQCPLGDEMAAKETAKMQLTERLKSLLFCKFIPYPPKATPALLLKLQEICSDHSVACVLHGSEVNNHVSLEGLKICVERAVPEVQEAIIDFQLGFDQLSKQTSEVSQYPSEWDPMPMQDQVQIVTLNVYSLEYGTVCSKFLTTLSLQSIGVVSVQRVQNKWLWDRYSTAKQRLHQKNAGVVNEKDLFHGTRDKPAETICRSEEGFDMRFSREGMWGQANYFAVNASYSVPYSYSRGCYHEMILAKVLTGDSYSCRPDSSLRMPPEKKHVPRGQGQIQQVRYDSVTGYTDGSQVFMTYTNDLAYPAYIITYFLQNN